MISTDIAIPLDTAFYEGEGDDVCRSEWQKTAAFSIIGLNWMAFSLKNRYPIYFLLIIHLVPAQPAKGFRQVLGIDADLVIPDKRLSVYEGAVAPWKGEKLGWWKDQFIKVPRKFDFPVHKPIVDLTKEQYRMLWEGNEHVNGINDFFKEVEQNLYKVQYRVLLSRYRGQNHCARLQRLPSAKRSLVCKSRRTNISANYVKCR